MASETEVTPTPICSKCCLAKTPLKRIGKGLYCEACFTKIAPTYPPRLKDSFEFYDKIYHPTTGKPPGTWEFADAYLEYGLQIKAAKAE